MRRLLLLVFLAVVLVVHPIFMQDALGQERSANSIRKAERHGGSTSPSLQSAPTDVVTLFNFDPEAPVALWFTDDINPPDSGFVHGTNWFEDQAKATVLTLPDGVTEAQLTEVNVYFSFKKDGLTTQTYSIDIHEGTAESGPGALLGSQTFMLANINGDEDFETQEPETNHLFSEPITVGPTFFVSVNFGSYGMADWGNASILASDRVGALVPEEWELWSDESWNLISEAWFQNADDGWYLWIEAIVNTDLGTAVEGTEELPKAFTLVQNFPNPFTASTTLQVEMPSRAEVTLHVVDLLGRTVATLMEGTKEAGVHTVRFESGDLPPGIYLARLQTDTAVFTRKMVLVR